MSASADSSINQDRIRQADKIAANPAEYKVCDGCGSIVTERTLTCPSCHAYRFDGASERVVAQAQTLARRLQSGVLSSDLA
jgi:ribosomal protein L37AE/L43A